MTRTKMRGVGRSVPVCPPAGPMIYPDDWMALPLPAASNHESRWPVKTACNVLFCTFVSAVLSLATEGVLAPGYFVVGYSIGFSVQVLVFIGCAYGPSWWPPTVTRAAMTVCGLALGLALGATFLAGRPALLLADGSTLLIVALMGAMALVGFEGLEHLQDARERLRRAERDAPARGKAPAESKLDAKAPAESELDTKVPAGPELDAKAPAESELDAEAPAESELDSKRLESLIRRLEDAPAPLRWLRVGRGEQVEIVDVDDVCFFRSDHKYTAAVTRDREHLVRMTISELAERLDPERFWRVHRGGIVNVSAIESARRDLRGRYRLALKGRPEVLRVSAGYGHLFRRM